MISDILCDFDKHHATKMNVLQGISKKYSMVYQNNNNNKHGSATFVQAAHLLLNKKYKHIITQSQKRE